MSKKIGGLSLTSLKDATRAFMGKWIIQSLLHSQPNLQVLLRDHITQLQTSCHGSWGPSSLWLFSHDFCQMQVKILALNCLIMEGDVQTIAFLSTA